MYAFVAQERDSSWRRCDVYVCMYFRSKSNALDGTGGLKDKLLACSLSASFPSILYVCLHACIYPSIHGPRYVESKNAFIYIYILIIPSSGAWGPRSLGIPKIPQNSMRSEIYIRA